LLVAAVVVAVGAILGVAGFALEQAHADWRPQATRTALGWRVSQPYLGINEPALAGNHLAWQAGPYTIVMDLSSGKAKLVGAARDAQSLTSPAVSPRAVLWLEYTGSTRQRTVVYAYDFSEHRRQRLLETGATLDTPAVAGATVYWLRGSGSATAVVACDIASDRKRVLATGSGLGPFLLADGSLVVWSHQSQPAAPFTLTVLDTAAGTTTHLALPGQTPGAIFVPPVLADGTLVWMRVDKLSGVATISTYDLRTLSGGQITAGRALVAPGFDGATVVWAQPAAGGGGYVVMGQHLAGGDAFRIARVATGLQSVMVSGDTVAWWMRTGSQSWIETARMPQ
jgi:hypothetical protein